MSRAVRISCWVIGLVVAGAASGAETLVDPTRPISAHAAPDTHSDSPGVHVQAIFSRSGSRIAIVNGKVVRAGDRLGNLSIEEVTADGVRFFLDGHSMFVRVLSAKL